MCGLRLLRSYICFATSQISLLTKQTLFFVCLSFARLLLLPKSTKVSFGVPVFSLAMTKSALHGKTQAFASNRRTPTCGWVLCPLKHPTNKKRTSLWCALFIWWTLTDSFNSGTGEFTRKVERQRVAVQGDSPRKFICAEDVYGQKNNAIVWLRYFGGR